ncbi:hypothetical protein [Pseudomonas songnenensis]|uniref:Uncharacterized protein n=1 Tax=Pseudomonas songnenensis TaxID=1176259 RepID=A0A482U771_9PSED|nr:hypothetical protein [Pseudomonas songnenensis]RYJ60917.1 hypothetical protein EJA06_016630 [Pseudomonas songnenensis]
MSTYRAEKTSELLFNFPDGLNWSELDKQGVKLPVRMKFVDLVIEREKDILLVEIKDPSHSRSQDKERNAYLKRLADNSVLAQELTPKARDSYLYLHLMERDSKPFKYVVLLGLDAFDPDRQKALMFGFKDRLLADLREESFEAWKRKHIEDCVVLSVETWNQRFPEWPIRREAPAAPLVPEGGASVTTPVL